MVHRPTQFLTLKPNLEEFDLAWAETPHSAQIHSGDGLDLRWFGTLLKPTWDHQRHVFIAKGDFLDTDKRVYQFRHYPSNDGGPMGLDLYGGVGGGSSTVDVPLEAYDGRFVGLRVTWRNSDGRMQFFYSYDGGETWTKLGADVTGGTGTLASQGDLYVGRDFHSAFTGFYGNVARAEIRDAPDGTVIASPDFSDPAEWTLGENGNAGDSGTDGQGNVWTLALGDPSNNPPTSDPFAIIREDIRLQYLDLNRGVNNDDRVTVPNDVDFDDWTRAQLEALIKPDQIASGATQVIAQKGDDFSTASWITGIDGTGHLFVTVRGDGVERTATSSVPLTDHFNDGDWFWVWTDWRGSLEQVEFQVGSGDNSVPRSEDPTNNAGSGTPFLVDLGVDQSIATGLTTLDNNTDPLTVGRAGAETVDEHPFKGKIAVVDIWGTFTIADIVHLNFTEPGPFQDGDIAVSRTCFDTGKTMTLVNNAEIKFQSAIWFPDAQGGAVLGSTTTVEKDLESDAIGGFKFGSNTITDIRIVGTAEGGFVLGSQSSVAIAVIGRAGLIFSSDVEVIPPEITAGIGSTWSVGVAGRGYMLSTLDQEYPFEFRSYEIQAIPQQRPQIDDKDEPGEQTLFPWWSRAQHSWHEGAGQVVFDSPFSSRFRYCESRGLDPWDHGELKLLKDTETLRTDTVDDHHLLATPDALFYTVNGEVHRDTDPDTAGTDGLTDHSGTPINSIASDGEFLYAAFSGGSLGIKKTPLAGALAWSDVNAQTAVGKIAVVKGRLIGAKAGNLYEYDLSITTEPEPLNPPMPSTWEWTGIAESGPAIYFSGHAGDRSEIFAVRLTAQDIPFSSVATLGAMRSIWQSPEGETVHAIRGFLGQQLLIGTSKGVRVGTIVTGDGDLEVSGLITNQNEDHARALNVKAFEPQGDFAWFTWSNYDDTRSGLGRIHLGELTWSSDLMHSILGEVTTVVDYQDRRYFVIDEGAGSDSHIIKEHATNWVPTARLELCEVRFGTREIKQLRHFDSEGEGGGTFSVTIQADGGAVQPVVISAPIAGSQEHVTNVQGSRFLLTMDFTRDSIDPTAQSIFKEWRLRSEPRSKGRFRYMVPLMIYDHVVNLADQEVGRIGYAFENLESLMELYRTGRDTLFHRLGSEVPNGPGPVLVIMEDLRFKTFTPPAGAKGFGGIALAILREVR